MYGCLPIQPPEGAPNIICDIKACYTFSLIFDINKTVINNKKN